MLYIVSTPIGNLSDITLRALEILKSVDAVLCEDTRVSKILLNHYSINAQLISYHSFNERSRVDEIIERLQTGASFALISDAGTPIIQDPGHILIAACKKHNISYTTVPGASSILSAIILSGFPMTQFQFVGFLSKKSSEAKTLLTNMCSYAGLSVFFESARRVLDTLAFIHAINPEVEICVIREITKKFEQVHKGNAQILISEFTAIAPRGEIVIVIAGMPKEEKQDYTELAKELISEGLSKKTAFNIMSKVGFVDKDLLYKL